MSDSMDNDLKCSWEKCKRKARWEVGFTIIVHDSYMFEGSGKNEFQEFFCDKHFVWLNGCGNTVEFRRVGTEKWKNFSDYDNPFILKDLVKKSYKVYVSDKIKFDKINNFFKIDH